MARTIKAQGIKVNDKVTYSGATFTAAKVERVDGDLLMITPAEAGICKQAIWIERDVEIERPEPTQEEIDAARYRQARATRIADLQREYNMAERMGQLTDEGCQLVVWDEINDQGHTRRKSREYTTRRGFLKALIRMESNEAKFSVVDVFESGWEPKGRY